MLDTVGRHHQYAATRGQRGEFERTMPTVFVISREPRTRASLSEYLRERGYDTSTAANYDAGMELLASAPRPDALIIDVQGLPKGEDGTNFGQFSQWMAFEYRERPPAITYLLHKGARKPNFKLEGPVIKKPFPLEALGEVLRDRLGHPRSAGADAGINLDLSTNTLSCNGQEAHLTNIEANLLAYLMAHAGEILNPRDLLVDVWQYYDSAGASTLVRAHMSNLRRKIRNVAGSDEQIRTVRGKGYRYIA